MKLVNSKTFAATMLVFSLAVGGTNAYAFGLPKVPGLGASNTGGATVNSAKLAINARNALYSFAKSNAGLAAALGGYNELAAQQQLLEGMKVGDAAASKEQIETLTTIHKSASEAVKAKMASNDQIDADQKKLASASMVEYVSGLVSSKKVVSSLQDVVKNPMAMGADADTLIYTAKEMPNIVSGGVQSTSSLFEYLSAKGVDVSEAKAAAADLGK